MQPSSPVVALPSLEGKPYVVRVSISSSQIEYARISSITKARVSLPENERGGAEQASDPYKRAEKLLQDILEARTAAQFEKVIEDAAPVDLYERPQLVRSDAMMSLRDRRSD